MSTDLIQSNYESLEQVAARFDRNQQRIQQMQTVLRRKAETLAKTWEGRGSQAFQREMQSTLFPALQRLTHALAQAGATTRKISQSVLNAEQEASSLFKGQAVWGAAAWATGLHPIWRPRKGLRGVPAVTAVEMGSGAVWEAVG